MRAKHVNRSMRHCSHCRGVAGAASILFLVTACSSEGLETFQPSDLAMESPASAQPEINQSPNSPGLESSAEENSGQENPDQTNQGQENTDQEIDIPVEVETSPSADLNVECDAASMQSVMLTLTNNARARSQNCGSTGYPATKALLWDNKLETAAIVHTTDMINNNFFSHTGSNGLSVSDRVDAQGFNWFAVGENIAAGQRSTESAMSAWMDSAGHCRNIMDGSYTHMAVACRVDPRSDYGVYWTAVYAR